MMSYRRIGNASSVTSHCVIKAGKELRCRRWVNIMLRPRASFGYLIIFVKLMVFFFKFDLASQASLIRLLFTNKTQTSVGS